MSDLSRYFEEMDTAIFGNGGTIDKYIGDAVMAIWNAPVEDSDHVVHACRAALACRKAEAGLNERVGRSNLFPTRTRFGLHTDKVLVGNVGSARRLQYTAIGGAVNLASRIEALNKIYGTDILVTQNVVDRAGPDFVFRPVDTVSPAGTTHPIALFELVCEAPPREALPTSDSAGAENVAGEIADWSAFYGLYRARDWPAALAALEALAPLSTRETLVNLYIDRCREFIRKPPPQNWDGVHTYDKK
jgi:adenylate cyclase